MPSHINGINGTNNQYSLNKITNYSIIENNNSADQYRQSDCSQLKPNYTAMNNNSSSIQNLEHEMSELCTYSVQSASNVGIFDEYRLRLNSENLGHQRPISCLRRANTMDGNLDIGSTSFGFSRGYLENNSRWSNHEILDETKLRDICARDALKLGYIVGEELELVKAKSHRSVIQNTPDRITSSFKDRYGQSDPSSKKTYLQLGVRVPTKEHVSEIVGKQGSKIKQIREKTGALITTPGEQEDHVFIIEAPPRTALHVAQILKSRAEDITMSRSQENRRRSSCPNNINPRHNSKSPGAIGGFVQSTSKVVLASGRIPVPKVIVGRIIGTQGSIITTIQRDTGTEIRSPPKEIGKPKHSMADFEILVYQTTNLTDVNEARNRVVNAKQLIAHIALHQLEKIRAEEAPYSNYQVQTANTLLKPNPDDDRNTTEEDNGDTIGNHLNGDDLSIQSSNKERLLTEQMRPFDWIWSDIHRLDDSLAREVVDRILEESKRKTKTRSEPSIYDNTAKNLFPLGESDSFTNLSSDLSRPRHSLPETNTTANHNFGLDIFYRPNLPFPIQNHFYKPDSESDFRDLVSMSFGNCPESGIRTDSVEPEMFGFQSQDFLDSQFYDIGNHARGFNDHIFMGSGVNYFVDQNFGNEMPSNYRLSLDNSNWRYRSNAPNNNNCTGLTKTYADSVRPLCDPIVTNISSTHGTIGDHLKRPTNYKG